MYVSYEGNGQAPCTLFDRSYAASATLLKLLLLLLRLLMLAVGNSLPSSVASTRLRCSSAQLSSNAVSPRHTISN